MKPFNANLWDRLVDSGNSVLLIEHHLDLIKNADWIIDLGPDGGTNGGHIMFSGTPHNLLKKDTHTAVALKEEINH